MVVGKIVQVVWEFVVILEDVVVKSSSKTMWNFRETYPVLIFRTRSELTACYRNIPRKTACLNLGVHFGINFF